MTEFEWVEGPLDEVETDCLEFHAFDPEAFIAGLRLDVKREQWVLEVTLRKGEDGYVHCRDQRVAVGDPEDKFVWAERELERFLSTH